jgi:probable F420-dependent oxidoreductase
MFGMPPTTIKPVAEQAQAAGFDRIWLADHAVTPLAYDSRYPYNDTGHPGYPPTTPLFDVWVTIAHLAAVLPTLQFGTGVYILPLRHPLVVAQAVRTAWELSGGRIAFGVGTGWMREEFDAMGQRFDARGARMDEMLDILERTWTGQPYEYRGTHYDLDPQQQGGDPIGPVPLVFGGSTPVALERTARRGDGWFGPPACPVERAVAHRDDLEARRRSAGRADTPFRYYVRVPDATEERFDEYRQAGFDDLVVSLPRRPDGTIDAGEAADFVHRAAQAAGALR